MSKTEQQYDSLPFLRFLAFLNIFLEHTQTYHFMKLHYSSVMGTSFFIVLSGYLYGCRYREKECKLNWQEEWNFCKRRVKKFYPLHIFMLLVGMPMYGGYLLGGYPDQEVLMEWLKKFLRNVFLVQDYFTTGYFSFNGVTWFLSLMVFLTVLTLPLAALLKKAKSLPKGNVLLGGILLCCVVLAFGWGYAVEQLALSKEYWLYICPPSRLPEYIAGMTLGFLLPGKREMGSRCGTVLEILSLGMCAFFVYVWGVFPEWIWRSAMWIIPNGIVIYIFSMAKGMVSRIFMRKPLIRLGSISFECFMIHTVIISYFSLLVPGKEMQPLLQGLVMAYFLLMTVWVGSIWHRGHGFIQRKPLERQ